MKKSPSKADLQRQVVEAIAGQAHSYHFAEKLISKAGENVLMGSGVILTITALGGKALIDPVLIRDGLSKETIEAIKEDLRKSYKLATLYKPTGV